MRPLPTRHRRIKLQVGSAINVHGAREEVCHFLCQRWVQQVQQQDHGGDEVVAGREMVGMIHLTPPAQNAHKCQRGDQYWEKQQASKFQLEDVPRGPCRKEAIYGQERVCNACCHGLDGEHATERFCPGNVHFGCQRGHLQIGQCYFLDTVRHAECTRAEHCHLDQGQRHCSAKDSSKAQLPRGFGCIAHVARPPRRAPYVPGLALRAQPTEIGKPKRHIARCCMVVVQCRVSLGKLSGPHV